MRALDKPPFGQEFTQPAWISWFNAVREAITNGLGISKGSQTCGTATLVNGSVVVSTNRVTANSLVMLSYITKSNPGFLDTGTRTVGTSFTISSSSSTDGSQVAWVLIEPL